MPCKEQLVQCNGCMQLGHLQEYCALNPIPSSLFTKSMVDFISHDLNHDNTQWLLHNAALADEVYKIKMGVVSDTLKLSTGGNQEEVRAHLARIYRGPQPPASTSYRPASTQSSAARQLPAPTTAARSDIVTSLPRPNIPQGQGYEHPYDYNTLAPLQLHEGDGVSHQHIDQVVSRESSSTSAMNHESVAAPGVQKTPTEPQHSLGFRTYDDNGDQVQVDIGGDSSGNGNSTPGSSPCDDRANSAETKDETELEREFFDRAVY
jgi:hypothetical protein